MRKFYVTPDHGVFVGVVLPVTAKLAVDLGRPLVYGRQLLPVRAHLLEQISKLGDHGVGFGDREVRVARRRLLAVHRVRIDGQHVGDDDQDAAPSAQLDQK